jgi:hypothetical protein
VPRLLRARITTKNTSLSDDDEHMYDEEGLKWNAEKYKNILFLTQ